MLSVRREPTCIAPRRASSRMIRGRVVPPRTDSGGTGTASAAPSSEVLCQCTCATSVMRWLSPVATLVAPKYALSLCF